MTHQDRASDMRQLVKLAAKSLIPLGYKKDKHSFWNIENQIYRLVDFQASAHGNNFFVNLGLHPVGLPRLIARKLLIPERPGECECAIRIRLEEVPNCSVYDTFTSDLVNCSDTETVAKVISSIETEGESWFRKWGDYSTLANASDEELTEKLTVVPLLKAKAAAMLRFYAFNQIGDTGRARKWLQEYCNLPGGGYDFTVVSDFLESIVATE